MSTAENLHGKRTFSDAFDLPQGEDRDGNTKATFHQRRANEDCILPTRQDYKLEVPTEDLYVHSSTEHIVAQERSAIGTYSSVDDIKPADYSLGRSMGNAQVRQVRVLESARYEHETNMQTLEARIRIGERGLGSLAHQLRDIQVAMKRRTVEIERIMLESESERAAARQCDLMIKAIRGSD